MEGLAKEAARKSVSSGGSRNGEHSSKRPRDDHDSTNEASGETGAEASADAITDSEETATLRVDTATGAMRMEGAVNHLFDRQSWATSKAV